MGGQPDIDMASSFLGRPRRRFAYAERFRERRVADSAMLRKGRHFIDKQQEQAALDAYHVHFQEIQNQHQATLDEKVDEQIAQRLAATGHTARAVEKAIVHYASMRQGSANQSGRLHHIQKVTTTAFSNAASGATDQELVDLIRWKTLEESARSFKSDQAKTMEAVGKRVSASHPVAGSQQSQLSQRRAEDEPDISR